MTQQTPVAEQPLADEAMATPWAEASARLAHPGSRVERPGWRRYGPMASRWHKWLRTAGAPGWFASSHFRTASTPHSHLPRSVRPVGMNRQRLPLHVQTGIGTLEAKADLA
jgi:hypothetical protein